MALVSAIGAYIGILVALIVGVAQIRVQLRQQADVETPEEGNELLPNRTTLESLNDVDCDTTTSQSSCSNFDAPSDARDDDQPKGGGIERGLPSSPPLSHVQVEETPSFLNQYLISHFVVIQSRRRGRRARRGHIWDNRLAGIDVDKNWRKCEQKCPGQKSKDFGDDSQQRGTRRPRGGRKLMKRTSLVEVDCPMLNTTRCTARDPVRGNRSRGHGQFTPPHRWLRSEPVSPHSSAAAASRALTTHALSALDCEPTTTFPGRRSVNYPPPVSDVDPVGKIGETRWMAEGTMDNHRAIQLEGTIMTASGWLSHLDPVAASGGSW
ncbi:hypothetical protein IWZ00DRAFT_486834 [Phyllosticta capitalensis]|uniref:uncharacterized protein n=1 Tax=Phyllosticta capitalensis TaxID=121624 RepID=UPI00313265CB